MIRRATENDIPGILGLLSQVLEIHAAIRPDVFIPGTTKYTERELSEIIHRDDTPVYVYADDGRVAGYAFCVLKSQPASGNMVQFGSLYIDDLCVDESYRGRRIGEAIFNHVKNEAKRLGCYEVTLNVWEGNDSAKAFYKKMGFVPQKTQLEYIIKDET